MSAYQLNLNGTVSRRDDGRCIPIDESNSDYQEYQRWLAEGNTPLPADPLPGPSKDEQIKTVLNSIGCFNEEHLAKDIFVCEAFAQLAGQTNDQAYASNATYHMLIDSRNQIAAIKAQS